MLDACFVRGHGAKDLSKTASWVLDLSCCSLLVPTEALAAFVLHYDNRCRVIGGYRSGSAELPLLLLEPSSAVKDNEWKCISASSSTRAA